MLRNKTLLVIGAGASLEAGLPLGIELSKQISAKLYFEFDSGLRKGDHVFFEALRQNSNGNDELNERLQACRRIHTGIQLARSIDNYIDSHRNDFSVALCGKLGSGPIKSLADHWMI